MITLRFDGQVAADAAIRGGSAVGLSVVKAARLFVENAGSLGGSGGSSPSSSSSTAAATPNPAAGTSGAAAAGVPVAAYPKRGALAVFGERGELLAARDAALDVASGALTVGSLGAHAAAGEVDLLPSPSDDVSSCVCVRHTLLSSGPDLSLSPPSLPRPSLRRLSAVSPPSLRRLSADSPPSLEERNERIADRRRVWDRRGLSTATP